MVVLLPLDTKESDDSDEKQGKEECERHFDFGYIVYKHRSGLRPDLA